MYLFRAVDAHSQTVDFYLSETRDREAAKLFLKRALANADNRPPHVFARDGLRSYPAAIRELQAEAHVRGRCQQRTRRYCNNRIESDHRHVKRRLRAMEGLRTAATAWVIIQGIEAAQRKCCSCGSGRVRHGVLPSTAVLEAKVRAAGDRDLRQVVLPLLPELARC